MKRFVFVLLVSAALACAAEPFFFVQLTDPQFGMAAADKDFEQETANFEFAIATVNRLKPAFVVVTGDLINKSGDARYIAEYKRIAAKLDPAIKIYNVPGNHDVGNEPTPASLAAWRKNFGPDYYSFRVADTAFFVLDTGLIFAPKNAPEEAARQERWLASELQKAKREGARHMVVFQHYSFFLTEPAEKDQYFNIPMAARRKYLDMLREAGVTHVFAGHYHRNAAGRDGTIEMVTTGPVGKPLGKDTRSGIRVVTVRDEGITHAFYDFGNLPNRIQ
jgi:3',5'-cyclic AMP phosphodiesterase CpdA